MKFYKEHSVRILALLVIGIVYLFVEPNNPTEANKIELAEGLSFTKTPLHEPNRTAATIREVNPALKHIDAWISSVGAAIAINDIDNDNISNDICHVDTRYNSVTIQPADKSDTRYEPFELPLSELRYDKTMAPMGCLPGDINEDGSMDIIVYFWGRTPIAFMQNNNGSFGVERFEGVELVDSKERWFTNAATLADLDGDGHKDLVIGNYFQDGANILNINAREPDEMQDSMSMGLNGGENRFLLWKEPSKEKQVEFEVQENTLPASLTNGWTLAVGAADLNKDLLPEIYFANDFGPDRLLLNKSTPGNLNFKLVNGEKSIGIPKSSVLGKDSFKGMGVDFGDINNDELLDLYVSNIADEYALLESHFMFVSNGRLTDFEKGIAPYTNKSEELGLSRSSWGWDSKLIDLNNDGVLEGIQATGFIKGERNEWAKLQELAMSNDGVLKDPGSWPDITEGSDLSGKDHNPIFIKDQSGKYQDVAETLGVNEPQVTRGIASGDIDADGDVDFAYANQWEDSYLYKNNCSSCGNSITLRLLMPINENVDETKVVKNNEKVELLGVDPVGAEVTATLKSGETLTRYIDGGNGHSGKRSYELHFGLGKESEIVEMAVRWRGLSGKVYKENFKVGKGNYLVVLKND